MATWKPQIQGEVGQNEPLGRRLFEEPLLAGTPEGKERFAGLSLRHFEETRDQDFSLDRLGRTGVNKRVKKYLKPRADANGRTLNPPRAFDGWAVLQTRRLVASPKGPAFPVTASPVAGGRLERESLSCSCDTAR